MKGQEGRRLTPADQQQNQPDKETVADNETGGQSILQPVLMLLGVTAGLLLGGFAPSWGLKAQFAGDLFMRALLMLAVPLVMTSIVSGVSRLGDVRKLRGIAFWTIAFFLSTTFIASCVGVLLVTTIQPGHQSIDLASSGTADALKASVETRSAHSLGQVMKDLVLRLIPENLFVAMSENNLLPIIFMSVIFGGVLTTIGKRGRVVIDFFEAMNTAIMKIVDLLMWTAPIGIGALIAGRLGTVGGFAGFGAELSRLGLYTATVLLGLALHALLVLPIIFRLVAGTSSRLIRYARGMSPALITAFSTASSTAALPVTMDLAVRNGVSKRTASFVLPLGATLNMNGTALYEAVAAIFIAQISSIHLGPSELVLICVTASLAAIGAAAIPEAGLITMVIVLKSVGLPTEGIALILMVDWFLDRFRTAVNVFSDSIAAAVIDWREEAGS